MTITSRFRLVLVLVLAGLCLGRGTALHAAEGRLDTLLDRAAAEPVYYGQPERCDSLVRFIAAWPPDTLLERLNTPWPIYYDLLRRALLQGGESSRAALIRRLRQVGARRAARPLLPVFEELGRAGDAKHLRPLLDSSDPALQVGACRCLARFGRPQESWKPLADLLTSQSAPVRLAAAWTVGELLRRCPKAHAPRRVIQALQGLLDDPLPQVRFTAIEALRLAEPETAASLPAPLIPAPPRP